MYLYVGWSVLEVELRAVLSRRRQMSLTALIALNVLIALIILIVLVVLIIIIALTVRCVWIILSVLACVLLERP